MVRVTPGLPRHASADDLDRLIGDLNRIRAETQSVLSGETARAADEPFALLFDGEYSVGKLEEAMSALGDLAGYGGADIEYTKLQIITALAAAAAELLFALAGAVATGGRSLATIPVVEATTVATIRQLVMMLIRRTASDGGRLRNDVRTLTPGPPVDRVVGVDPPV
jgi:hypothetical protein